MYGEGTDGAFRVSSLDVPVVKVGAGNASLEPDAPPLQGLNPSPLPIASLPRLAQGFAFNIQKLALSHPHPPCPCSPSSSELLEDDSWSPSATAVSCARNA